MNMKKYKEPLTDFVCNSTCIRWIILISVTLMFTVLNYPNLVITKHSYSIGDVVERDIKAPKDFFIEDSTATEQKRRQAAESVLTVYDHDTTLSDKLARNLDEAFSLVRSVYDSDDPSSPENSTEAPAESTGDTESNLSNHNQILQMKEAFEGKLGLPVNDGAYKVLEKERFPKEIPQLIAQLLADILDNGVVSNKELLLKEADKGITLRNLESKSEKTQFLLKHLYSLDQSKAMVRIIGQPLMKELNYNLRNLVVDFTQSLIQPNITMNRSETEERKKQAAGAVKPILYQIKAGEMLLREGERVTEMQLLKLGSLQDQINQNQMVANVIGAAGIILCLFNIFYFVYFSHQKEFNTQPNKNLLFIATIFILFCFITEIVPSYSISFNRATEFSPHMSSVIFGIPLASSSMLICMFLGIDVAMAFSILIATGSAIILQNRFEVFIYVLLSCLMAAYWIHHCQQRKMIIQAGLKISVLNMVLAIVINTYSGNISSLKLLWDTGFAFLGGVGSGIVTLGLAPLIEVAFGFTTEITFLELANLERPILRRLMIEAPGTYHHSVVVGTMVEAAAAEIGANSLLAKVCGYYHDIGKIKKPLYFIENQINCKNKHDKLAPSMSSLILISHVKDGVEIAKKYKLGQSITDAIKQHHGNSLISFFYEKAKQLKGKEAVNIDNYRYPGPRPQTREAGLVMLADVVEAASRTLENPTPARIQGLVQKLINKIFSDGQLDDCELTLKDLHLIAKSFHTILNGIHHHRIEYTESIVPITGKVKDGHTDKQQPKQTPDTSGDDQKKGQSHLKRLGLS
ncbi:MAG: HDIG domain-containing protein [Desulfobacterales bacterium]|nr:HDIG domain-containing protein [Desulfobacterales bacterium]